MVSLCYLVDYKPMDSAAMNIMEFINDIFVLITTYWFFLYTDLISEVETRYNIGSYYKNMLFVTITINGIIVFSMIGYSIYKKIKLH